MVKSKSFISKIEQLDSKIWSNHLKVPEEVVLHFKQHKVKRLICTINGELKIHCAIMYSKEGPYILTNKQVVKHLSKANSSSLSVKLEEDTSKYGMEMPEEFDQCLKDDPIGFEYFNQLTPGKQRNLIHMVANVKSSDIKIRRALAILEHLFRESGKLDFKKLNEVVKEFNQKFKIN